MNWKPWPIEIGEFVLHALAAAAASYLYFNVHPLLGVFAFMAIAYREGWQREPAEDRPFDPLIDWTGYALGALGGWIRWG